MADAKAEMQEKTQSALSIAEIEGTGREWQEVRRPVKASSLKAVHIFQ